MCIRDRDRVVRLSTLLADQPGIVEQFGTLFAELDETLVEVEGLFEVLLFQGQRCQSPYGVGTFGLIQEGVVEAAPGFVGMTGSSVRNAGVEVSFRPVRALAEAGMERLGAGRVVRPQQQQIAEPERRVAPLRSIFRNLGVELFGPAA